MTAEAVKIISIYIKKAKIKHSYYTSDRGIGLFATTVRVIIFTNLNKKCKKRMLSKKYIKD